MRNYWIELTLTNGRSFSGCVAARGYRAARETVLAAVPKRTITHLSVEAL